LVRNNGETYTSSWILDPDNFKRYMIVDDDDVITDFSRSTYQQAKESFLMQNPSSSLLTNTAIARSSEPIQSSQSAVTVSSTSPYHIEKTTRNDLYAVYGNHQKTRRRLGASSLAKADVSFIDRMMPQKLANAVGKAAEQLLRDMDNNNLKLPFTSMKSIFRTKQDVINGLGMIAQLSYRYRGMGRRLWDEVKDKDGNVVRMEAKNTDRSKKLREDLSKQISEFIKLSKTATVATDEMKKEYINFATRATLSLQNAYGSEDFFTGRPDVTAEKKDTFMGSKRVHPDEMRRACEDAIKACTVKK
jgi:hypothetical protein